MSRQKLEEFTYLLERQDCAGTVLLVEGVRDALFFEKLVPLANRVNSTVVPVGEIEVPAEIPGGDRGRVLWLADYIKNKTAIGDRVRVFIDADLDRFIGVSYSGKVYVTDYSDLESYVLNDCSMSHILYSFGKNSDSVDNVRRILLDICKPIKLARLTSATSLLNLPINATLGGEERIRLSRYIELNSDGHTLNLAKFVNACHQNARSCQEERVKFSKELESNSKIDIDNFHWFQGKDLASALSYLYKIGFREAVALINLAIISCIDIIRQMPSMRDVDEFLRI